MKNLLSEFKDFINRGNVIDLAVAVVLAAAFAPVIASIVEELITPIVAAVFGQPDFTDLAIDIGEAEIGYGVILTRIISFLTIAAAVFFFVVKPYNTIQSRTRGGQKAEEDGPTEVELLIDIRDQLRSGSGRP